MAKKITGYLKLQVPAGAANPVAADRSCARSARPQHHGVLQGVQRPDPEDGEGHADPGRHHHLCRPLLHLRDEARRRCRYFLKKAANLRAGPRLPGRDLAGSVTKDQVKEIAEQKMKDLNCDTVEAAMRMVEGSARSMGIR